MATKTISHVPQSVLRVDFNGITEITVGDVTFTFPNCLAHLFYYLFKFFLEDISLFVGSLIPVLDFW